MFGYGIDISWNISLNYQMYTIKNQKYKTSIKTFGKLLKIHKQTKNIPKTNKKALQNYIMIRKKVTVL